MKTTLFAVMALLLIIGCSQKPNTPPDTSSGNPATTPAPGAAPGNAPAGTRAEQKPAAAVETLPAKTVITVKLSNAVGSKISHDGDRFTGTVAEPVEVNGKVAIPAGANAEGIVATAAPLGRFKGGSLLRLRLESVDGYPVQATLSRSAKGKGKRTAVLVGGGAGLGALIGGLAGGGKGAGIGALAGAGAGTGGAAFTGNKDIVIPAESAIAFEVREATPLKKTK